MDQFFIIVASAMYLGMLPFFPGVWGSAGAMVLWYFCKKLPIYLYSGATALLFVIGTVAADRAEAVLAEVDASPIVIDEVLGVFIALAMVANRKIFWFGGLALFLVLDGLKPFPASWVETNVQGGLGIMLDDLVAGVYALIILQVVIWGVGRLNKE